MGAGVGTLEHARKNLASRPLDERVRALVAQGFDEAEAIKVAAQFETQAVASDAGSLNPALASQIT